MPQVHHLVLLLRRATMTTLQLLLMKRVLERTRRTKVQTTVTRVDVLRRRRAWVPSLTLETAQGSLRKAVELVLRGNDVMPHVQELLRVMLWRGSTQAG